AHRGGGASACGQAHHRDLWVRASVCAARGARAGGGYASAGVLGGVSDGPAPSSEWEAARATPCGPVPRVGTLVPNLGMIKPDRSEMRGLTLGYWLPPTPS